MKKKLLTMMLLLTMTTSIIGGCGKSESPVKEETATSETETESEQDIPEIIDITESEEADTSEGYRHYDILPEVANAAINEGVYQIGDIVLRDGCQMSEADVAAVLAKSDLGAYIEHQEDGLPIIYTADGIPSALSTRWYYLKPDNEVYPVSEEGFYLDEISIYKYIGEDFGIDDSSVYSGGGFTMNQNGTEWILDATMNHDDFIAHLENIGAVKVDKKYFSVEEISNGRGVHLKLGDKGYYADDYYPDYGQITEFELADAFWFGKATQDGSQNIYYRTGEARWDENGTCTLFYIYGVYIQD